MANFALADWSEPSQSPPGGNVPAPINIGITRQNKMNGIIGAGKFCINDTNMCLGPLSSTGLDVNGNLQADKFCLLGVCIGEWKELKPILGIGGDTVEKIITGPGISISPSTGIGIVRIANSGVTKIIQGSNITVSGDGTGEVTISATGGGGGGGGGTTPPAVVYDCRDGAPGSQGPEGLAGPTGPQGPAGEGLPTNCSSGQVAKWNGSSNSWACANDLTASGGGTGTGGGSTGGPATISSYNQLPSGSMAGYCVYNAQYNRKANFVFTSSNNGNPTGSGGVYAVRPAFYEVGTQTGMNLGDTYPCQCETGWQKVVLGNNDESGGGNAGTISCIKR